MFAIETDRHIKGVGTHVSAGLLLNVARRHFLHSRNHWGCKVPTMRLLISLFGIDPGPMLLLAASGGKYV